MQLLSVYLIVINIVGFALMAWDKRCAIDHAWRISEKTLFIVALIGGSFGCWIGMYAFRHKTQHTKFVLGMPLILAAQLALIVFVF